MTEPLPAEVPVPDRYVGLWRRSVLEDARGTDTTTRVYWLQSGSLYADIRVPAARGQATTPCVLTMQQGFAGRLEVKGAHLRWQRWLDYQPPGGLADLGRVHFRGQDLLVEEGVLVPYVETWERIAPASADRAAFVLQEEQFAADTSRPRNGVLIVVGDWFMYALDRPLPLPAATNLAQLHANAELAAPLREVLFDCEISLGLRDAGRIPWEIGLSTLPQHEGRGLFEVHGAMRRLQGEIFEQRDARGTRRRWQCVERGPQFRGLV